jgi:hypothetical protein
MKAGNAPPEQQRFGPEASAPHTADKWQVPSPLAGWSPAILILAMSILT